MSEDPLRTLMPVLNDIPASEVDTPDYPVAIAIHQARQLLAVCVGEIRQRLIDIGVSPEDFDRLPLIIEATDEAQTSWVMLRDDVKGADQIRNEQDGYALRAELVASCRFNLREDRLAQGMLDAIVQDEGPEALIEDLACLSRMLETRVASFDNDLSFDAPEQAERARLLAAEIRDGLPPPSIERRQIKAKEIRDRAYSLLDDAMHYLRDAGAYAFRREPELRALFSSIYRYRKLRRSEAQTPALTEPRRSSPPI